MLVDRHHIFNKFLTGWIFASVILIFREQIILKIFTQIKFFLLIIQILKFGIILNLIFLVQRFLTSNTWRCLWMGMLRIGGNWLSSMRSSWLASICTSVCVSIIVYHLVVLLQIFNLDHFLLLFFQILIKFSHRILAFTWLVLLLLELLHSLIEHLSQIGFIILLFFLLNCILWFLLRRNTFNVLFLIHF